MFEIPVTTNAQIDAEEKKKAQTDKEIKEVADASVSLKNDLVGHVKSAWDRAKFEKMSVQQKMIDNLLQKRGEYDPVKLSQIKQLGSEIFMMITDVKCRMALAMLREIYNHPGERCFALEPTPLPKLTPQMEKQAEMTFMVEVESFLKKLMKGQEGQEVPEEMVQEIVTKALPKFKKEYRAIRMEIAKDKAQAMEIKIEDQLTEGGYFRALAEFLADLVDLKAGFLKGPVYRQKKVVELIEDSTNPARAKKVVKTEIRPEWDSPSAFDIFPLPGVTDINKGGLIEVLRYTRKDLQDLIGLEGYDEVAIREILEQFQSKGLHQWTWDSDEIQRAEAEGRDTSQYYEWETIDALEYHNAIPGRFIMDWAGAHTEEDQETFKFMGKDIDPDFDYDAIVWMVDHWILKITINENPLGTKPYYKASYVEQKGSFWGRGLPETIPDGQAFANSAIRGCQNNIGIASGPQIGLDTQALAPGQDPTRMWPWKIWRFMRTAFASKTEPFMQFFQPQMHVQELIMAYDKASKICDEHSGIAGFTHGDRNIGGAGNTLGGFAMFAGMQNRGIRDVAFVIDEKVVAPSIVALYYENYDLDDALEYIGDVKIKAKGSSWLLAKETQALRLTDFLRVIGSSPVYQQIIGEEGARYGLEEAAKNLNLDSRRLVPDKDLVKPIPGAEKPTAPLPGGPNLDQAGNKVGGVDNKITQGPMA
jgi:hypothetical protein